MTSGHLAFSFDAHDRRTLVICTGEHRPPKQGEFYQIDGSPIVKASQDYDVWPNFVEPPLIFLEMMEYLEAQWAQPTYYGPTCLGG